MAFGIGLYIKHSVEAVQTYMAAFEFELGYHVLNDDGTYFHSELMKDGKEWLSVVEGSAEVTGNPVQLGYTFRTREELDRAYDILSEGGLVKMERCELPWSPYAAEVVDKYGVDWYLTIPQHRPSEDFKPSDCK